MDTHHVHSLKNCASSPSLKRAAEVFSIVLRAIVDCVRIVALKKSTHPLFKCHFLVIGSHVVLRQKGLRIFRFDVTANVYICDAIKQDHMERGECVSARFFPKPPKIAARQGLRIRGQKTGRSAMKKKGEHLMRPPHLQGLNR